MTGVEDFPFLVPPEIVNYDVFWFLVFQPKNKLTLDIEVVLEFGCSVVRARTRGGSINNTIKASNQTAYSGDLDFLR